MSEQVQIDILAQDRASPAWKAQANAVHAYLQELAKLDSSQKANERSAAAYDRAAKHAIEQGLTPLERYNRRQAELKELLDKNKLSQEQYNRAVAKARDEMSSAETATSGWAGKLATLTPAALGIAAITLAIKQARAEFENLKAVQKDAATSQITFASAQRSAINNLANDMTPAELNASVESISRKTGATQLSVMRGASAALSSKGAATSKEAMEALAVSFEANPDADKEKDAIESAKANLLIRSKNKGVTARQAAGFLIAAKQQSPTDTDEAFASTIAPAIANAGAVGTSARDAAALLATMGSSVGDTEGRVTATSFIDLQKQLAEALPKVQGGTIGRLEALQTPQYAKVKKKLLGVFGGKGKEKQKADLHGEAKLFFTMVDLIKGDGATSELLKQNLAEMPEMADAAPIFDATQAKVNSQPVQMNAALERGLKQSSEEFKLRNIVGARGSITREGLQDILKQSGSNAFAQSLVGNEFEFATKSGTQDPAAFLRKRLTAKADNLEKESYIPGDESMSSASIPAPAADREAAAQLRQVVIMLEKLAQMQAAAAQKGVQKVEVIGGKFTPTVDPTPAQPRPAAGLGG